jgi:hypothetical protein
MSPPSPLNILFYVDSGAGQSMCSCPDAFLSLRPCAIEVVGVSGSLPIFGIGTAIFIVTALPDLPIVLLLHNCLLSQGSPFNLLSVSQLQTSARNSEIFPLERPHSPSVLARAARLSLLLSRMACMASKRNPSIPTMTDIAPFIAITSRHELLTGRLPPGGSQLFCRRPYLTSRLLPTPLAR